MSEETIWITGASSGIGRATALKLANNKRNIIISGRRRERLTELANHLKGLYKSVYISSFDVQNKEACFQAVNELPAEFSNLRLLVNNAGLAAGLEPFQSGSLDDWDQMIDTNVKGLLYLSKACIPLLKNVPHAQIVNVGSIAGKEVYPMGNVYCASKHAVDALTRAMRIDLLPDGIRVCLVSPGLVETEFSLVRFKGDSERAKKVYDGIKPLLPDDVADAIKFIVDSPVHVTIGDILILPAAQAASRDVLRKNAG